MEPLYRVDDKVNWYTIQKVADKTICYTMQIC